MKIVRSLSFEEYESQEKEEKRERGRTCGNTDVSGVQLFYKIMIVAVYTVCICIEWKVFYQCDIGL